MRVTLTILALLTTMHTLADHPGASLAWTSDHAALRDARDLVRQGRFSDADRRLESLDEPAAHELRELLRRIRWEYALDDDAMLRKLRSTIPAVTKEDLKRWRDAGELQFRVIDGNIRYFRREPSNLFRFCDEARRRRLPISATQSAWVLEQHLSDVIAGAERSSSVLTNPVRHVCRYTLTVPANHPLAKPGALVRCWLPFPQEHERQKNVRLLTTSPSEHQLKPTGTPQRSLYLERRIDDPTKPVTFSAHFEYTSSAYYPRLDDAKAKPLPTDFPREHLSERLPHIAFTPELRKTVAEIVKDETNPLILARRLFEWVDANIRYCAEEEYCTIPSFAEKALATRKGDCGIQATLFITMCRAAGIPARWQSGWQTRPDGINLHDWAEFYVEPWGWLPADPSYGLRQSADPKVRWFYFGHQDSYRMIVNLDYGAPLVPTKHSLRSEPADFQRGEVEIDGKNLYFNEWDYDMKIEWSK